MLYLKSFDEKLNEGKKANIILGTVLSILSIFPSSLKADIQKDQKEKAINLISNDKWGDTYWFNNNKIINSIEEIKRMLVMIDRQHSLVYNDDLYELVLELEEITEEWNGSKHDDNFKENLKDIIKKLSNYIHHWYPYDNDLNNIINRLEISSEYNLNTIIIDYNYLYNEIKKLTKKHGITNQQLKSDSEKYIKYITYTLIFLILILIISIIGAKTD